MSIQSRIIDAIASRLTAAGMADVQLFDELAATDDRTPVVVSEGSETVDTEAGEPGSRTQTRRFQVIVQVASAGSYATARARVRDLKDQVEAALADYTLIELAWNGTGRHPFVDFELMGSQPTRIEHLAGWQANQTAFLATYRTLESDPTQFI